jgi:hypothetical protein
MLHPADQDSVRLLAVESCGAFAAALSKDDCSASLLPVVQKFAQVSKAYALGSSCLELAASIRLVTRACRLLKSVVLLRTAFCGWLSCLGH